MMSAKAFLRDSKNKVVPLTKKPKYINYSRTVNFSHMPRKLAKGL